MSRAYRTLVAAMLVASSSVTAAMSPTTLVQPTLAAHVAARATSLRDAGIERIVGRANRGLGIQVLTIHGPSYVSWPAGVTPTAFELDLDAGGRPVVRVAADVVASAGSTAALDAAIDSALRAADATRSHALRPRP